MDKNLESIQQAIQISGPAAIPRTGQIFLKAYEQISTNEIRSNLGPAVREEILRLVQRIFLQDTPEVPRAVLFAGVDQGNGSSQICLRVAETLASSISGSICIVEANFRSPSLPDLLGTTNHYGLSDSLQQDGPIRSFARPLQSENVWLLSCGSLTPDSPNLLKSDQIAARFVELRKEFDYLLIDAPSLTRYEDAIALGRLIDGLVIVLETDTTRKETALRVIEKLRAAQIQVLGAVLN